MKYEKKRTNSRTNSQASVNRVKFLTFLESWIRGEKTTINVSGTEDQIRAVTRVLEATKKFHDEISKSDASLAVVSECLDKKRAAAVEFEQLVGMKWPL